MKKILSIILALTLVFTLAVPSFAASKDDWSKVWKSNDAEAGIIMFVGSNETERNFSWYSETESEPTVTISTKKDLSSADVFKGTQVEAIESGKMKLPCSAILTGFGAGMTVGTTIVRLREGIA